MSQKLSRRTRKSKKVVKRSKKISREKKSRFNILGFSDKEKQEKIDKLYTILQNYDAKYPEQVYDNRSKICEIFIPKLDKTICIEKGLAEYIKKEYGDEYSGDTDDKKENRKKFRKNYEKIKYQ